VDLVQPGVPCEPAPELGVVDNSVDQFLPAAGVDQNPIGQVELVLTRVSIQGVDVS
jgi:hypothetical protein